jgi:hypothetical protein
MGDGRGEDRRWRWEKGGKKVEIYLAIQNYCAIRCLFIAMAGDREGWGQVYKPMSNRCYVLEIKT